MKKAFLTLLIFTGCTHLVIAQNLKEGEVPAAVKSALKKKYAEAKDVQWEKEKGNYEANWGGKSKEDNSVQFTPTGNFIEIVKAIPVKQLPAPVLSYVQAHYKGAKITEAGKVTDAEGTLFYEAEVNKKDIIFDNKGNFIKAED
jgi:Putative beta-lactamase-inhibitor-like, PepSY-like